MAIEQVCGTLLLDDGAILVRDATMFLKNDTACGPWCITFVGPASVTTGGDRLAALLLDDGRSGIVALVRPSRTPAGSVAYKCIGVGELTSV